MSSFIYTLYEGADPGHGWTMNDPIFGPTPTLGACVPNIRRNVKVGDWIFAISGRVKGQQQFVVGGFRVAEKIDALAAYERFPENRVRRAPNGQLTGNVIVTPDGRQHPDDTHSNFERRLENYLVGDQPTVVAETKFEDARAQTLPVLSRIFGRAGNRVFDVIGRARSMEMAQVDELRNWIAALNQK